MPPCFLHRTFCNLKSIYLLVIAVIGVVFAITVFFTGQNGAGGGMFSAIGDGVGQIQQLENIVEVSAETNSQVTNNLKLHYTGGVKQVGDIVALDDMLLVENESGSKSKLSEANIIIDLINIKDASGNSQLGKYDTEYINSMEVISTAVVYDTEQHVLYFHESGVFNVLFKIYTGAGEGILYEFNIPVEMR